MEKNHYRRSKPMAPKPKPKKGKNTKAGAAKKKLPTIKKIIPNGIKHPHKREKFVAMLQEGKSWEQSIMAAGLDPIEAAQVIDEVLRNRRDGVACFMLAEQHIIASMGVLNDLSKKSGDEKIRLMAAAKLADTAFKILINRPYIEQQKQIEQVRQMATDDANTWDAEFEHVH
jgi:hypothetical protein